MCIGAATLSFREGLLKARGQITFIVALAISTGFIIYLEALDTEDRIQSRVATELARQKNAPAVPPSVEAAVRTNLARAEEAYAADPTNQALRAALLTSLSSAVQLGIRQPDEGLAGARKVLEEIERQRGDQGPVVGSALGAAALAFPQLQERIVRLSTAP
jgi:hypothetical protein